MFVLANQGMARPFEFSMFADSIKQLTKCTIVYDGVRLREDRVLPINPYLLVEFAILPSKGQMSTPQGPVYPSLRWHVVFGL